MDISILVVCYKARDLIAQCLRGVYAHTSGCTFEVLIVDCSNDGTEDLVRRDFPQVRVIPTSTNLGYGAGNNLLAEHAVGDFFLLLNPDTIIEDDAIGELFRTAVDMPDAGAIGGWTRRLDGSRDPGCRQFVPTLTRLVVAAAGGARFLNGALPEKSVKPAEVETLSGAFMLVRADAWRQVQGFDTSYFMYSEELDLCVRLRSNGWGIVMTPRSTIIHLIGNGNSHSPRRTQLLNTGRMHFLRKFWSRPMANCGGTILWLHGLIRVMVACIARPVIGSQRAKNLFEAYSGIVLRPATWWYGFNEPGRS